MFDYTVKSLTSLPSEQWPARAVKAEHHKAERKVLQYLVVLVPVLFALLSPLWVYCSRFSAMADLQWTYLWSHTLAVAGVSGLFMGLWWVSLRVGVLQRKVNSLWGVLACLLVFNAALAVPSVERGVLGFVSARAAYGSYVAAVIGETKELDLLGDTSAQQRVVFMGSSQINFAINEQKVQTLMPDKDVFKIGIPAMDMLQYLFLFESLDVRRGDVIVCWISEFDVYRGESIAVERLRFFADAQPLADVVEHMSLLRLWAERSNLADLALGSFSEVWRLRDALRVAGERLWLRRDEKQWSAVDVDEAAILKMQQENLRNHILDGSMRRINQKAFELFADKVTDAGARLVVVQGQSKPSEMKAYGAYRKTVQQWLQQLEKQGRIDFVPETQVGIFKDEAFFDFYHLDAKAREAFSKFIAAYLSP